MGTSLDNVQKSAHESAKLAVEGLSSPVFLLFMDCISRYLLMAKEYTREIEAVFSAADDIPALGVLTFGEIGSYSDVPLMHNKTVVAVAGGEK